jgi:5'-nucleotidase
MRKLIIGLDVDAILAQLHEAWLRWYNARWHDQMTLADITVWGWHHIVKPGCGQRIYEFLDEPDLYEHVAPIDGAPAAVAELRHDGHDLVAITHCFGDVNAMPSKVRWVMQHFDFPRRDIFTGERKELLYCDVLVEDAPHNIQNYREAWQRRGHQPLIVGIEWPYNHAARSYADLLAPSYADTPQAWQLMLARIRQFAQEQP